jgi:hypothetical protein
MANEANGESGATHEGILGAMDEALGELLGGSHETDTGTGDTGAEGGDGVSEEGVDSGADEGAGAADTGDESGGDEAGGDEPEGEGAKPAAAKSANEPDKSYSDTVKDATKLGIQQRHDNGQIKSKAELQAEIAAKQQGGDGKGGQAAGKKEPDPVNDSIDKNLPQPTQERIRTLIARTKEADERAAAAEGSFNTFVQGLQAANVTPEQYGETVSFLGLFNSGDPKQQTQALEILEGMADRLASFLGVERKAADPLANHADLKQAVQNRQITPELARQQAVLRNQQSFRQEINTHAQNSHTEAQRAEQEKTAAVTELNQLEAQLRQNDPLYERKKAAIMPAVKAALVELPPSKWKGVFQRAYAAARVAAPQQKKAVVPAQQPMRAGKSPAGSGANAKTGGSGLNNGGPKSMFEAMWGAPEPGK